MAKHRLKQKKARAGKQLRWGLILLEGVERSGRTPVSHHAEDRIGFCGRCGHPWAWHDNVWLKVNEWGETIETKIRCRGAYPAGLTAVACQCREVYTQVM